MNPAADGYSIKRPDLKHSLRLLLAGRLWGRHVTSKGLENGGMTKAALSSSCFDEAVLS